MKEYLFIINPVSGGRAGDVIRHRLLTELKKSFATTAYDILITEPDGLRMPPSDYHAIVVAGGDGTVWQTLQKLMKQKTVPRLGIVPIGTGNDLARASGMLSCLRARGIAGILQAIKNGSTMQVDVLRLNHEFFFTNYYGIGIDAVVAGYINRHRPRRPGGWVAGPSGKFLYFLAGLKNAGFRLRCPVDLLWEDASGNGHSLTVPAGSLQIIATNTLWYGGGALPSSGCRMDDGFFEITVTSGLFQWTVLHLTRFFRRPLDRMLSGITQFQARSLTLSWEGSVPCQMDGETFITPALPPHTITCAARLPLIIA